MESYSNITRVFGDIIEDWLKEKTPKPLPRSTVSEQMSRTPMQNGFCSS